MSCLSQAARGLQPMESKLGNSSSSKSYENTYILDFETILHAALAVVVEKQPQKYCGICCTVMMWFVPFEAPHWSLKACNPFMFRFIPRAAIGVVYICC